VAANRSLSELCEQTGDAAIIVFRQTCRTCTFLGELGRITLDALRHPRKIKYDSIALYMERCGSDAMPITALLGTLIGVILAVQAITQLGRFGVQNYVVNLVGTVIVTELAPLVTAVVLAGRSGSAFAAEIGTMKSTEEIDAMVTMGLDTGRFLIFPKFVALLLVLPGLTIIADVCGIFGAMLVTCSKLNMSVTEYYNAAIEVIKPLDLFQGLFKSACFAVIVASIGCMKGIDSDRDAQGVGRAATAAVVTSILLIVITDALLTAMFSGIENLTS
jgi:phospholipid/cholesterol/gamma-HCH transport system permease protein